jgi:hypothetical protein
VPLAVAPSASGPPRALARGGLPACPGHWQGATGTGSASGRSLRGGARTFRRKGPRATRTRLWLGTLRHGPLSGKLKTRRRARLPLSRRCPSGEMWDSGRRTRRFLVGCCSIQLEVREPLTAATLTELESTGTLTVAPRRGDSEAAPPVAAALGSHGGLGPARRIRTQLSVSRDRVLRPVGVAVRTGLGAQSVL